MSVVNSIVPNPFQESLGVYALTVASGFNSGGGGGRAQHK